MNSRVVKVTSGELYEIQWVFHSSTLSEDVAVCYRLSSYDGMPIGGRVNIPLSELVSEDRERAARQSRKEDY